MLVSVKAYFHVLLPPGGRGGAELKLGRRGGGGGNPRAPQNFHVNYKGIPQY